MTNKDQEAESEYTEAIEIANAPEKSDEDVVLEAIEAANLYHGVSGIGTERGFLENLLERSRSGEVLSQEQLDHALLVQERANEVTNNYVN